MNGYVEHGDGRKEMWVARRSKSKPTWPGKLDHIVAGGQPYGLSPSENMVKECEEEAGIDGAIAKHAVPVGAVSYCSKQKNGLKRDVLFCLCVIFTLTLRIVLFLGRSVHGESLTIFFGLTT